MYGREELKVYTLENVEDAYNAITHNFESWESEDVIKRDEADSVMDAMEARIQRLKVADSYHVNENQQLRDRIKELEAMLKDKDEAMDTFRGLIESANVMSKDAEDKLLNRIKELEAENNSLKADIEILNDDCRIAKENEVKYHKAYLNELDENARLKSIVGDDEYKQGLSGLSQRNAELREENEKLKTQVPKWISVNDRLPKEGTWCIVFHEGEIDSDHYTTFAFNKKLDFALYGYKVTHWMPLPPPPTTEESSATEKEN